MKCILQDGPRVGFVTVTVPAGQYPPSVLLFAESPTSIAIATPLAMHAYGRFHTDLAHDYAIYRYAGERTIP